MHGALFLLSLATMAVTVVGGILLIARLFS